MRGAGAGCDDRAAGAEIMARQAARRGRFARLVHHVASIEGLMRLRYIASHQRDMDDDMIAADGDVDALMHYQHLPMHSGSDRVLAAMNRGHTREDYLRIVARM